MKTEFKPDGDEIVVNGGKTFITNGAHADLYTLFGKWSDIADTRNSISVLMLEKGTPGLKVVREEDKMGLRASSTATLAFDSCRVPRANLLGEPGDGLKILLASLNKSRPSTAAHALGIARAAFEDAVAYINERRQSGHRIVEFQGIQFMLADMATDLAMCEAWLVTWHGWSIAAPPISASKRRCSRCGRRISPCALRPMRCSSWRIWILQGLSRRAADAGREDHADLGRNESDSSPVDRQKFHSKVSLRARARRETKSESPVQTGFVYLVVCALRRIAFHRGTGCLKYEL